MNYKPSQLTDYWLGTLPPAELEQIEVDYFTDDDFYGQLIDAKEGLIKAYLRRQLSRKDLRQFEEYFLTQPGRFDEVMLMKAVCLHQQSQKETLVEKVKRWLQPKDATNNEKGWIVAYPAWAAMLLVVGLSGWWVFWKPTSKPAATQIALQTPRAAQLLQLGAIYRGDSAEPFLPKHEGPQAVTLQIPVEFHIYSQYGFKIVPQNQPEQVLHRQIGLAPQPFENKTILSVELPALQLPAGNYQVVLLQADKQGVYSDGHSYPFSVR